MSVYGYWDCQGQIQNSNVRVNSWYIAKVGLCNTFEQTKLHYDEDTKCIHVNLCMHTYNSSIDLKKLPFLNQIVNGITWSKERSLASCDNIPATNASPAPVVSTASTFKPFTLPLNSWKHIRSYLATNLEEKVICKLGRFHKALALC